VSIVLGVMAIVAVVVCALGWRSAAARVTRLEARVAGLEREVHRDVLPALDRSQRESEAALSTARQAAVAAGIEEPPPRLAGEAVTGPVVRAVAFGAGARRAIARMTADVVPLSKTRRVVAFTAKRSLLRSSTSRQSTSPSSRGRNAG
jgi:hypothetical protein